MDHQLLLEAFLSNPNEYTVEQFGSGLIHQTFVVKKDTHPRYILQEVNTHVFKAPYDIASNLHELEKFLLQKGSAVFFPLPMATLDGNDYHVSEGRYFRMIPFMEGTHSVDFCSTPEQAYEASFQFGRFSAAFNGFQVGKLKPTIPQFHDLTFRWHQFTEALQHGNLERIQFAKKQIVQLQNHHEIVTTFDKIKESSNFFLRVTHHDTKINNVLFGDQGKGVSAIDLDTVMPGYFISDVGDMCRTYLSPGNEEETDLSRVFVRKDFYQAITEGYLEKMAAYMSKEELFLMSYSGKFMIYMQALRFMTDFLNDDRYYGIRYPLNNFDRTINQLWLLEEYIKITEKS